MSALLSRELSAVAANTGGTSSPGVYLPSFRGASTARSTKQPSYPAQSGVSSTPRLIDSIINVSGILDHPLSFSRVPRCQQRNNSRLRRSSRPPLDRVDPVIYRFQSKRQKPGHAGRVDITMGSANVSTRLPRIINSMSEPSLRGASTARSTKQPSYPAQSGVSSTPRLIDSIINVSGILDRPPEPVIGRAFARPVGSQ